MSEFYNPTGETQQHGVKLPHWQQDEVIQFVTFRLGDSMPSEKLHLWKQEREVWISHHPEPWTPEIEREYHRLLTWKLETWLDEGHGSCVFTDPTKREILATTLIRDASHFDNTLRYIRRNPVKSTTGTFTLWLRERAQAI